MDEFRNMLKIQRRHKRYTQAQLADALDLEQNNISDFETGRREPTLETLVKLCLLLDIPADCLLNGDEYDPDWHNGLLNSKSPDDLRTILYSLKLLRENKG